MTLCVLSLTATMCVMHLNSRADQDPVTAMPNWVRPVSLLYKVVYALSLTCCGDILRAYIAEQPIRSIASVSLRWLLRQHLYDPLFETSSKHK